MSEETKKGTLWIDYIEVPTWYGRGGGIMRNRECLSYDDPEQTYNYIKRKLQEAYDKGIQRDGKLLKPQDFNVVNPKNEMFRGKNRDDLIDEILDLRKNIESYEFNQVPFKCSQ